jgi:hypothetical protein
MPAVRAMMLAAGYSNVYFFELGPVFAFNAARHRRR